VPSFGEISGDFLRISSEVVWATVATVDTRGRPRTRVLHPIWEVVADRPVGWIGTTRTPLKEKHLAANPCVSLSYWSPKQETAHVEARASWADEERERVWEMFVGAPPPLGYDPATIPPWKDGPLAGPFSVLRLEPWRVMVLTAEDAASGRWYERFWRSESEQPLASRA
jgi:Pyridoxamine 5'-phosphate oxidase